MITALWKFLNTLRFSESRIHGLDFDLIGDAIVCDYEDGSAIVIYVNEDNELAVDAYTPGPMGIIPVMQNEHAYSRDELLDLIEKADELTWRSR